MTDSTATVQSTTVQTTTAHSALGRFIGAQVTVLQRRLLSGSSVAQADLARLRRAVGKPPGAVPEVWELTLGGVPIHGDYIGDEPSYNEWAAHIALTLNALHQRSKSQPMHQPGIGLGTAVARLRADADSAITRRFAMVSTATEISETTYHLRSLIGQLREPGIGLDYGLLAEQLVWLQIPERSAAVRLAWGRDFYRTTTTDATTTDENGIPA